MNTVCRVSVSARMVVSVVTFVSGSIVRGGLSDEESTK